MAGSLKVFITELVSYKLVHVQWRSQEVLFGGVTININYISKQQKTQEEEKNLYHYHYI